MPAHRKSLLSVRSALLAFMIVPPIAFVVSIPWLKQQSDSVVFLTAIAATLTIVASLALSVAHDRHVDEWQRSAARFASQWGLAAGSALVGLALALPLIHDWIVSGAEIWGGVPDPDRRLVLTTFSFGFMATVLAQGVCTALLGFGWTFWKSRSAHDPS